jgi:hypothetical protein
VLVGLNIEETQSNGLANLDKFDVAYLPLIGPVNEFTGRFSGIRARNIWTTILLAEGG